MVATRGRGSSNRAASYGHISMSSMVFERLPFRVKQAKLDAMSGQELLKYSELATNAVFRDWQRVFSGLEDEHAVSLPCGIATDLIRGPTFLEVKFPCPRDYGTLGGRPPRDDAPLRSLGKFTLIEVGSGALSSFSLSLSLSLSLALFDEKRIGSVEEDGFLAALRASKVPLASHRARRLFSDLDVKGIGRVLPGSIACPSF